MESVHRAIQEIERDGERLRVLRLAIEQSKSIPYGFVAYITEYGMRAHVLELAASLGYECVEHVIKTRARRHEVRLVTVGHPKLRCCTGVYVDPLVTRREEHSEFWAHVDDRMARIAMLGYSEAGL